MKIRIQFDGGCNPNPGKMYGSYSVEVEGCEVFSTTEDYGDGTNNVAEFTTLHRALLKTEKLLTLGYPSPNECDLEIFTDSTIVQNRINGTSSRRQKKPNEGTLRMTQWQNICLDELKKYRSFKAIWNSREVNVERFGH